MLRRGGLLESNNGPVRSRESSRDRASVSRFHALKTLCGKLCVVIHVNVSGISHASRSCSICCTSRSVVGGGCWPMRPAAPKTSTRAMNSLGAWDSVAEPPHCTQYILFHHSNGLQFLIEGKCSEKLILGRPTTSISLANERRTWITGSTGSHTINILRKNSFFIPQIYLLYNVCYNSSKAFS